MTHNDRSWAFGPTRLSVLLFAAAFATACAAGRVARAPGERLDFEESLILATPAELAKLDDRTLFSRGASAFAAREDAKASLYFGRLVEAYPRSKYFEESAYKGGVASLRLARYAEAIERLKLIADAANGTGDSLQAAFRLSEAYYYVNDYEPAVLLLGAIAERSELEAEERLQAMVQRGICFTELKRLNEAERALRVALKFWEERREQERLDPYFPAQAQFFLGEILRLRFEEIALDPAVGQEQLAQDLERKCEELLNAQAAYLRAMRIGEARWGTAAGFRVGALYEELYDALVGARTPGDLDEAQAALYREELLARVRNLVSKAMYIYERTIAAAERVRVDTPFIHKTRESLERMKRILQEGGQKGGTDPRSQPEALE